MFGLDIGSSEVKLLQLRKHGHNYRVVAAATAGIEAGEGDHGDSGPEIFRAINRCLGAASGQTQFAVCGVCGPEVAVRCFQFPSLLANEIQGAVLLEAAQVCPFNVDASTVDYQLIPNGDGDARGVMVAATNEIIRGKKELMQSTALKCVLVDVDGLALLNCYEGLCGDLLKKDNRGATTAILNVGSSFTTLAIHGGNGLPFIRDVSYAGKGIAEQTATETNMSVRAVQDILAGRKSCDGDEERFNSSFGRACERLIGDVAETLRYYLAKEKSATVEKVLVCGGFASAKGFVELLDSGLPYKVELWNPLENVRCEADSHWADVVATKGPAMAVAAGLAMRSI